MMFFFASLIWWCFDDHLAAAVGTPGLGSLPFWVPVLACLILDLATNGINTSKN